MMAFSLLFMWIWLQNIPSPFHYLPLLTTLFTTILTPHRPFFNRVISQDSRNRHLLDLPVFCAIWYSYFPCLIRNILSQLTCIIIIFDMGGNENCRYRSILVYVTLKNESNYTLGSILLEMSLSYFLGTKHILFFTFFPLLLRCQWMLNYLLNCLISVLIWRKISHWKCFDQRFEIIDQKWESYHSCLTW